MYERIIGLGIAATTPTLKVINATMIEIGSYFIVYRMRAVLKEGQRSRFYTKHLTITNADINIDLIRFLK